MIAVVSGDEQQGNHMTNAVGSSVRMQKHYQEVRDCLKEHFDCIVGTVMANKLAVLVPYEKEIMDYNERIELIESQGNWCATCASVRISASVSASEDRRIFSWHQSPIPRR